MPHLALFSSLCLGCAVPNRKLVIWSSCLNKEISWLNMEAMLVGFRGYVVSVILVVVIV